jgi:endonuclease G
MRHLSIVAAAALCVLASAAAAQTANDADVFTPGPNNDPATCSELWQAVGLPDYARGDERGTTIVCHTKYVLSHNNDAKTPDWVLEHLTAAQIAGNNKRPKMKFQPDPSLDPNKRAVDSDYVNSGFDRGHQAPSDDFKANVDWMKESFVLSNIVPQVGIGFNRDIWAKLEMHVRDLARSRNELYVITGPVYPNGSTPVTISATANTCHNEIVLNPPARKSICGGKGECQEDGVIVPNAMYKIVYDPTMGRVNAFLMPNINHRDAANFSEPLDYIRKFQITVQALERVTELDFFPALPARVQRTIKRECAALMVH